jgi:hypothetical protein
MRTDLSQYYHSTNPSVRLSYITSEAENVNFIINGTDLMLRDFNVFATTRTNHRSILDQLKQLAITNNTSGASIYDLGNIVKAESIAEVTDILKDAETKMQAMRQQEMQQQQKMQEQQIQAKMQEEQLKMQFEAQQQQLERQKDITVAEIRAAGYGSGQDVDQNLQSDYLDAMKDIRETTRYREQMDLKKQQNAIDNNMNRQRMEIEKEKLRTQREIAEKNLEIARTNKNKYDVQSEKKKKDE